jgi:hypothetical protein
LHLVFLFLESWYGLYNRNHYLGFGKLSQYNAYNPYVRSLPNLFSTKYRTTSAEHIICLGFIIVEERSPIVIQFFFYSTTIFCESIVICDVGIVFYLIPHNGSLNDSFISTDNNELEAFSLFTIFIVACIAYMITNTFLSPPMPFASSVILAIYVSVHIEEESESLRNSLSTMSSSKHSHQLGICWIWPK